MSRGEKDANRIFSRRNDRKIDKKFQKPRRPTRKIQEKKACYFQKAELYYKIPVVVKWSFVEG